MNIKEYLFERKVELSIILVLVISLIKVCVLDDLLIHFLIES